MITIKDDIQRREVNPIIRVETSQMFRINGTTTLLRPAAMATTYSVANLLLSSGRTMAGQTVDYNMVISGEGHVLLGSGKQPEY